MIENFSLFCLADSIIVFTFVSRNNKIVARQTESGCAKLQNWCVIRNRFKAFNNN